MGVIKYSLLVFLLCLGISLDFVHSKSITQTEAVQQKSDNPSEGSLLDQKSATGEPRRVVTSWNEDGTWQGSARLPSSSQSGGNDHSSTKTDLTNGRTIDTDTNSGRNNRRLHKLKKTEEISEENEEDGSQLAQSLTAISSHLLDTVNDESLENSSERDVYINKNEDATSTDNDTDEALSDEDSDQQAQENGVANPTVDPKTTSISTWHDENEDTTDEDKMIEKQKSDGSPTTPKGLTTWSAVNGGSSSSSNYIKGNVQKLPSDYTVSGALSFSTDRPTTTIDMVVIKDRSTYPTTEVPRTTKANNSATKTINRRKPYNKNKKVVQPSKFVKPPLDEVTAEAIGSDATHTIYKTKVTEPVQSKISPPTSNNYNPYTTKKPLWPYQMPTKRIVTTRRPIPFSRITAKPKNPYVKRPQTSVLTLTTPTTTTPASTTVYHRNPGAPVMYPFPSISFTNLGFMDFLRSQIIPRIGLSLISFMAASPLILSMLGASAVGRRKKRDISLNAKLDKAKFESMDNLGQLPKFDFSTIKKKLQKLQMTQNKKKNNDKYSPKQLLSTFSDILDNIFHSKAFSILKSKLVNPVKPDNRKLRNL